LNPLLIINDIQDNEFMGWKINDLANKAMHMKAIENLRSKNAFTAKYQTMQQASSQPYLI
jgi:hypothetical protein